MGSILGGLASVIGIGSGVKNLTSNSSSQAGGQGGPTYVPQGSPQIDQMLQQILPYLQQQGMNVGGAVNPAIAQAYGQDQAGAYGLGGQAAAGQQALNQGATNAYGSAGGLMNAGTQLWNTASDPQQALYNQLYQQTQDASRAGTSARGIGMGGEAAGIENQDLQNFMLNWQNQQLGRQATGLQGLNAASQASGAQSQLGNADLTGALGMGTTGAMLPYSFANAYTGAAGGANNLFQNPLQGGQNYLNTGIQGSNSAFNQGQQSLGNLTTGLNSLGNSGWLQNLFGGGTPSGYGYGTNYGQDNTSLGPPTG